MGEKLRQSDISDAELFGLIIKSAKDLKEVFHEVNTEVNKTAAALDKMSKEANTGTQKGINSITTAQKKMNAEFKKAQSIEKETIKNSKALQKERLDELRLQKAREVAVDRFNKKQEIAIRQQKREAQAVKDSKNAYKILTKQVNLAQAEFKRLAAQHGVNSKQARLAKREFDRLDKELRQVNNAARDGRRDVGRYGLALNGVRGSAMRMLGALGLLGGGLAIFRNAFNTVKDFEQGQADLASVLEINVDGMKALTDQARALGGTTTFTATEVAGLQKEFAKLGFTQKQIENVTEATLLLAEATGTDLAEAARVAGGVINGFGLDTKDTQRVVDVMAKSFSKSGLDMEKFAETMKTAAPIANATGVSLEVATAAAGKLADNMITGSKAGTDLKRIFSELVKDGKPFEQSLDDIAEKLAAAETPAEKLAIAEQLVGERAKGALLILAEQKDGLSDLKDELLNAEGAAKAMAETQRNTLGGALKLLSSSWSEYILKVNESTGASGGLKDMVVFLSDNLETIVDVLVKVIKFYALYRGALIALKLSNHIKEIRSQSKALKTAGVETKALSEKSVKLKGALKAIGWAAAIALVMEYVSAVKDAFDGTTRLKDKLDEINAAIGKHEAETNKRVETRQANLQKELTALEKSGLKGIELEEAKAAATKKASDSIQKDIDMQMRNAERAAKAVKIAGETLRKYDGVVIKSAELAREQGKANATQLELLEKTVDKVAESTAEYNGYKASLTLLVAEMDGVNEITSDIIESTESNTGATNEQTGAVKEEVKAYKELTDILGILNEGQSVEEIESEEIAQENEAIQRLLNERLTFINDQERLRNLTAKEAADQRKIAQIEALLEQRKILLLYGRDVIDIDLQISQARLDLVGKVQDETIASEKKHLDELLALRKNLFDSIDKFAQKALDKEISRSQKKQEILDKEISNSQLLEDHLRESAQNQNAVATESLAAQSDISEEKERQKIAEAKKQERIEELKALWNTLNSFLSQGDSPLIAGGKAAGTVSGFKQLFGSIAGFFDGTKGRLKDEHKAQMSGRDGHVVRVDGDEAILTGDKMDRLAAAGLTSTNDIVNSAIMNQQLIGVPMANHIDDRVIITANNSAMENKLDAILVATEKNRPIMESPILRQGKIDGIVYAQENDGKLNRKWMYRR